MQYLVAMEYILSSPAAEPPPSPLSEQFLVQVHGFADSKPPSWILRFFS